MSAEDDERFLRECFVETSDIVEVLDVQSTRCIALGRTGVGKSAMLWNVEKKCSNVRRIDPEALSLSYISNSTILNFFEELDVDLDIFYQLLWRHVLAIELIDLKKEMRQGRQISLYDKIVEKFSPDPRRKQALQYILQFGDKFWVDTEKRVREVVHHLERSLEEQIGSSVEAFKLKLGTDINEKGSEALTQTTEIIDRAKKVVSGVQIQELNKIMDFLAEDVFGDIDEKYYIIIDDLDTDWASSKVRYKLIRALIETVNKFRKISNLKIVIGLRADLLETVLQNTASSGFQTEKYEDMFLRMNWDKDELIEMADRRLNEIFKDQYQNRTISFYDVFPLNVSKEPSFDFILDRTLHRPRDVIAYINEVLRLMRGPTIITQKIVRDAEASYSKNRFRSLTDEWREAFGDLTEVLNALREFEVRFKLLDVTEKKLENLCVQILAGDGQVSDGVFHRECSLIAGGSPFGLLRRRFLEVLYIIGAIGVRIRSGTPYQWSYQTEPVLNVASLDENAVFAIHPMLFRELNRRADVSTLNPS